MFDDERRSATVESIEETEVIAILGRDMRRLLREHPDIAVKLIAALGRRLRETNERLARQSFQTVQSRVASVLAQLVGRRAVGGRGEGDVLITATQAEPRPAGRLLARVGQPLPGRARAGRDHHPGTGKAHRPRPRRARSATCTSLSGRAEAEFSAGGVVVRGDEVVVIVPVKRGRDGHRVLGLPKGHPDGDETPEAGGHARGGRGDRGHGGADRGAR